MNAHEGNIRAAGELCSARAGSWAGEDAFKSGRQWWILAWQRGKMKVQRIKNLLMVAVAGVIAHHYPWNRLRATLEITKLVAVNGSAHAGKC